MLFLLFVLSFVDVYALHYYLLVVMKPLVLLHNYNNINSAKQVKNKPLLPYTLPLTPLFVHQIDRRVNYKIL